MVGNVNFKDYLNQQLLDPQFKQEFENETTKLKEEATIEALLSEYREFLKGNPSSVDVIDISLSDNSK